jgi:hypothetical protein
MSQQFLKELRKIVQMPDQKHWNCTEMRERALEEWINKWVIAIKETQLTLNLKQMPIDIEDMLKEQVVAGILDQVMTEVATITKENNRLTGELVCIRRKPKS